MKEEYRIFQKNLTLFMSHYGYSQAALAKKLEIAPSTVAWWCHGERLPRFGKMRELTELFHCTQDDFLNTEFTESKILAMERLERLQGYLKKMNDLGIEKVLTYVDDLSSKYFQE